MLLEISKMVILLETMLDSERLSGIFCYYFCGIMYRGVLRLVWAMAEILKHGTKTLRSLSDLIFTQITRVISKTVLLLFCGNPL